MLGGLFSLAAQLARSGSFGTSRAHGLPPNSNKSCFLFQMLEEKSFTEFYSCHPIFLALAVALTVHS